MTNAGSQIDQLVRDFPNLPRETIVRQYVDALSSVELFAVSARDEPELAGRLARSHLEALAQLRNSADDAEGS